MDLWLVITLRIIHILTGAGWVGGAFLLMGFLTPTARGLGPKTGSSYLNRFVDHPRVSVFDEHHARLARLGNVYMGLPAVAVAGMASAQYLN